MAMIPSFIPNEVPADERSFGALPVGKYPVVVTESEVKATKNGNGSYLDCTLEVIEGDFKGRKLWAKFNVQNSNQEAVRIAQRQLADMALAVGHQGELRDSADLHYKPLIARVEFIPSGTVTKSGYRYDQDSNDVKGFEKYNGAATGGQGNAPSAGPTAGATNASTSGSPSSGAAPWQRAA